MLRFLFCCLAFVSIAMPAAADTRTIDMTVVLRDERGEPLKDISDKTQDDPDCSRCRTLTLGRVVANSLFVMLPDERDLSGEQKFARGVLASRVENDQKAQLSAEEIVVIKRLIGRTYGAGVVTQVYPLLDPNIVAEKLK